MGAKRMSNAVFAGVATILVMALAISIIFSLILKFTSLEEQSVRLFLLILSFITLFIGGFIAGGRNGSKGLLVGGATGISYSFLMFLLQFLGYSHLFSAQQLLFHAGFIGVAILGGIVGVNIAGSRET
ncbi:TIGR04086 family membrane protein [Priestia megaterium]